MTYLGYLRSNSVQNHILTTITNCQVNRLQESSETIVVTLNSHQGLLSSHRVIWLNLLMLNAEAAY